MPEGNKHVMKGLAGRPSASRGAVLPSRPLWKKLKRWLQDYKWPLIVAVWVVVLALGYVGFKKHFSAIGQPSSPWDNFYLTLQLFSMQSGRVAGPIGWEFQMARFVAPALTVYTAAQALTIIFHEWLQLFRLRFLKDHIIICGLGRKGLLLAQAFHQRGEAVVVIEQDADNSMLRRCKEHNAIILIGSASDPELLRRARVHKARCVISVCRNDGTNGEVAVHAGGLVRDRKGKALSCLIHIVDPQLCDLLREQEIRMGKLDAFRLGFFNVFESGARVLLNEYPPFSKTGEDQGPKPHIAVVGIGRMGESLVVNAARNWWDGDNTTGERLRITLIDKEADRKKESLCVRHPKLEGVCELVPVQMDIQTPEFERAEFLFNDHGRCDVTRIYVCLDDDSCALGAALKLQQRVRGLEIPLVVRMIHDAGLATLLQGDKDKGESFANLHPFGLLDRTCTPDLIFGCIYELLARAIHEDYVRHEREKGLTPEINPSMVPWEDLPESLKESNRNQAEHIRVKLEAISCDIAMTTDWDGPLFEFSPEEVELMAEMEHERFVKERRRQGWTYGSTKDLKKKTSPTLILWSELSDEEKDNDRNAVQDITAVLARGRFQIYRLKKDDGGISYGDAKGPERLE